MDLSLFICPRCHHEHWELGEQKWVCKSCKLEVPTRQGKPFFNQTPQDIIPFEKSVRGPDHGTPWRQANWKFLKRNLSDFKTDTKILDVGSGRGDFADILKSFNALAVDVIPFAEVDAVCDLTQTIPFRPQTFDAVVLMNVLEHVYQTRELLEAIHTVLKNQGKFVLTVPFLLKMHFEPYDFYRFTQHSLMKLFTDAGFQVEVLEGYYDPVFLMGETFRNIQYWELSKLSKGRRLLGRLGLAWQSIGSWWLSHILGAGKALDARNEKRPAPVGYMIVLKKTVAGAGK